MGETLTIAPKASGKGRSFKAQLLGFVTADGYHPQGSNRVYRPVYLSVAESDAQVRAVGRGQLLGRKVDRGPVLVDHAREVLSRRAPPLHGLAGGPPAGQLGVGALDASGLPRRCGRRGGSSASRRSLRPRSEVQRALLRAALMNAQARSVVAAG